MKRFMKFLLPVGLFLLVTGCGEMIHEREHDGEGPPTMEGIYLQKEEHNILIEGEELKEEGKTLSLNEFMSKNDGYLLKLKDDSELEGIKSGTKVKVWCGQILESSPPYAVCQKIEAVGEE
jgi:Protein of unknown function (DUF3221)